MFEKIRSVILEYVDVPEDSITPETQFLADLAMSSLEIMSMIGQLEDEMNIEVNVERLHEVFTIQDLMDYIEEIKNENL